MNRIRNKKRLETCGVAVVTLALAGSVMPAAEAQPFERKSPVVIAVEKVGPAVVNISTAAYISRSAFPWFQLFEQDEDAPKTLTNTSLGSGVIIDPRGVIVTNQHVVMAADKITVTLSNGKEFDAKLVNADVDNDVALLKVTPDSPLPYAELGTSGDLMIGETCIAVGSPFGLSNSVTTGVISAKNRSVNFQGREIYKDFLQTSAVIHPGNSGGPLLDVNGRVIGINVGIHRGGAGIGFAIPADRIHEVAEKLLDFRITRGAWIGADLTAASTAGPVTFGKVNPDGPAARAGIRQGEQILALDGEKVRSLVDLKIGLLDKEVGSELHLRVKRDGKERDVSVSFEALPDSENPDEIYRRLGITVADAADVLRGMGGRRVNGVVVMKVRSGGPADDVEIRQGDILLTLGRYALTSTKELQRILRHFQGARSLDISLARRGEKYSGTIAAEE